MFVLPLQAQDVSPGEGSIQEIVVRGTNVYRDRTDDINPTLSYNLDFFQRFEPLTVGEMLKRTPGVVFTSDVLEYDAVQLRGMSAEYTEVLINGRRIPGQGADRTFFVDRIPAELVESIEIVRSPSADMTSEGVAGSLNIILKDGAQLEGILARASTTYYGDGDGELRNSGALAIAGSGDSHDYWLGLNTQERRNPKKKVEEYFDEQLLEGFAFEEDTRDGTDYSLNGSLGFQLPSAELRFNGYYVLTDRTEQEVVTEFEGATLSRVDGTLVAIATQEEDIDQDSWGVDGHYQLDLAGGELALSAALSRFSEDTMAYETEEEFDDGISEGIENDSQALALEDTNYSSEVSYTTMLGNVEMKTGLAASRNNREGMQAGIFDIEAEIEETRLAPYSKLTWEPAAALSVEAGVRYDRYEREVSSAQGSGSGESRELLPSLSLRWDLSESDRFTASLARTQRQPGFDLVTPFEIEEEPDDEDLMRGNPELEAETSVGFDIGYERRLPGRGIVGINLFHRDVDNVIELIDTGIAYNAGSVYSPQNVGSGRTWGVELDVSTPLSFIGLPNTGFYANYAYLDSKIEDPFTGSDRAFQHQPDYVYNVSLTQDLPSLDAGMGISYQKRGASLETAYEEYVVTEYDGNLELFFEKNLGQSTVLRLSGTNLLDQEKVEYIRDYGDPINEMQYEQSSRTVTLTLRSAF